MKRQIITNEQHLHGIEEEKLHLRKKKFVCNVWNKLA